MCTIKRELYLGPSLFAKKARQSSSKGIEPSAALSQLL
jgi:hypothetical protein